MEHRWGERVRLSAPVRVIAHSFSARAGRLINLSVSGGFIKTDVELRLLSRIQVALDLPVRARSDALLLAGYISRKSPDGIGIEWCEFAPEPVSELLKSMAARRYSRIHTLDTPVVMNHAIIAEPLLRHG